MRLGPIVLEGHEKIGGCIQGQVFAFLKSNHGYYPYGLGLTLRLYPIHQYSVPLSLSLGSPRRQIPNDTKDS